MWKRKVKNVNCNKSRDVYYSIEPLYVCTLAMGLSPYGYNRTSGQHTYRQSKFALVYSLLVIISLLALRNVRVNEQVIKDEFTLVAMIDRFKTYSNNAMAILVLIFSCVKHKHLIHSIDHIDQVDKILIQLGLKNNFIRTRNFMIGYILLTFLVVAILETGNCSMFLYEMVPMSILCWLYCYVLVLIVSFMEFQFITYILLLKCRFSLLNGQLVNEMRSTNIILETSRDNQWNYLNIDINIIQQCHIKLSETYRSINDVYSIQLLFSIGLLFAHSTVSLLKAFQKFKKDEQDLEMLTSIAWASYYIARLFLISKTSESTTNEGNSTGYLIHQIHPNISDNTNKAILMFSKQIIHNKLTFSAFGFFPINMTLFFSIMAAVAIYLLILVQMDIPSSSGTTNNNNTLITTIANDLNVTLFL